MGNQFYSVIKYPNSGVLSLFLSIPFYSISFRSTPFYFAILVLSYPNRTLSFYLVTFLDILHYKKKFYTIIILGNLYQTVEYIFFYQNIHQCESQH
jgi:hypothetical protein